MSLMCGILCGKYEILCRISLKYNNYDEDVKDATIGLNVTSRRPTQFRSPDHLVKIRGQEGH